MEEGGLSGRRRPLLPPDNRCCFCLTLRSGCVIVAVVNFVVNLFVFSWYSTSPKMRSSFGHVTPVTNVDISVFTIFAAQVIVDALLVYSALRRVPAYTIPWLCANSVLMGIMIGLVAVLLFFGFHRLSLDYDEYVSALSLLGCFAAGHFFACLVVFQFRKNLIEEIRFNGQGAANRDAAAAGRPFVDEEMPQSFVRPPSPPPTYEEVSKLPVESASKSWALPPFAGSGEKCDADNEPPEYAAAVAQHKIGQHHAVEVEPKPTVPDCQLLEGEAGDESARAILVNNATDPSAPAADENESFYVEADDEHAEAANKVPEQARGDSDC